MFVINPFAGGKKNRFKETEHKISEFASGLEDPYEIYITKEPMDASSKVALDAESEDQLYVYACGGDGTLSECANGAALRANVAITHYPCGTGNDFIKMFGDEYVAQFEDLHSLANGTVRPLDLIKCGDRYGINICSVGIDARVGTDVHKYSKIPIIGGATGYVTSLIVNVIKGVKQPLKVITDSGTIEKELTLVCACNGRFYGGGFNPVPDALPNDGILEYLIVSGVSRFKVAQIVGKYAKGRFRELDSVITHIRGAHMTIESERELIVNIDGEAVKARSICFDVVPSGINFIFPS